MARKKQAQHDNHDRWLVSYADFITLLFAFFVMMFASSQTDRGKAQQVSESVRKALEETHAVSRIVAILGGSAKDAGKGDSMAAPKDPGAPNEAAVDLLPSLEFLSRELSAEIRAGTPTELPPWPPRRWGRMSAAWTWPTARKPPWKAYFSLRTAGRNT